MAAKKERWGAYIKPPSKEVEDYTIRIGKFDKDLLEPGEMFTSSPAISQRIAEINRERELKGKVLTGVVSVYVRQPYKDVRIISVIPFT